jgi:uncharacterized protein YbjT (DUF2867 family)
MVNAKPTVLLTGATGFVGNHIYPTLRAQGFDVLCGARDPEEAAKREPDKRWCRLDLEEPATLRAALGQVDRAVYLAHSMADRGDYARRERRDAEAFRDAAAGAHLNRIVYLGGMQPQGEVSHHLQSRLATGATLRAGQVPTIELRATMIIGGGSESFRMVRDLAARLPWMLLPRWLDSRTQPVAIADIGEAIAHALAMPITGSAVYAAPGPEELSGKDILLRTAALLGYHPRVYSVPLITPRLSAYWIHLITRANPQVTRELVEGLRSDIVAEGKVIWKTMPHFVQTPFDEAARSALREEAQSLPMTTRLVERALHGLARDGSSPSQQLR